MKIKKMTRDSISIHVDDIIERSVWKHVCNYTNNYPENNIWNSVCWPVYLSISNSIRTPVRAYISETIDEINND